MSWFEKILPEKINIALRKKQAGVPHGVWDSCKDCRELIYASDLIDNLKVCPNCSFHYRISAKERITFFLDDEPTEWIGENVLPLDFLKFQDHKKYKDRLADAKKKTKSSEALSVTSGTVLGIPVTVAAFEFGFMGGSMGSVVGERFCRAVDNAIINKQPYICFSSSGGARMQESLTSLMQMSKTSAALSRLRSKNIPYISILTDPTMGGVSASLAMLGDIIIAEPMALIGFAGPNVVKDTMRERLPDGFQRSEFLLEHGAIDMITDRRHLKKEVSSILSKLGFAPPVAYLK